MADSQIFRSNIAALSSMMLLRRERGNGEKEKGGPKAAFLNRFGSWVHLPEAASLIAFLKAL